MNPEPFSIATPVPVPLPVPDNHSLSVNGSPASFLPSSRPRFPLLHCLLATSPSPQTP